MNHYQIDIDRLAAVLLGYAKTEVKDIHKAVDKSDQKPTNRPETRIEPGNTEYGTSSTGSGTRDTGSGISLPLHRSELQITHTQGGANFQSAMEMLKAVQQNPGDFRALVPHLPEHQFELELDQCFRYYNQQADQEGWNECKWLGQWRKWASRVKPSNQYQNRQPRKNQNSQSQSKPRFNEVDPATFRTKNI